MTKEEAREAVQELLKDNEPEVVAEGFIKMYLDGKLEIGDLIFLVDECGFELDEEFLNAKTREEQKKIVEERGGEEEIVEEEDEDEEKVDFDFEEDKEEDVKEVKEEDRASKSEDYNGTKVYDKKGNPEQVEEEEQEKAEKLYNLKF